MLALRGAANGTTICEELDVARRDAEGEGDFAVLGEGIVEGVVRTFTTEADITIHGGDGIEVGFIAFCNLERFVTRAGHGIGARPLRKLHANGRADGIQQTEEVAVRDGRRVALPSLLGEDGAVANNARQEVTSAEARIGEEGVVIPHGPRATEETGVVGVNAFFSKEGGVPLFPKEFGVKIIAIATDIPLAIRDDVGVDVKNINDVIASIDSLGGILPTE